MPAVTPTDLPAEYRAALEAIAVGDTATIGGRAVRRTATGWTIASRAGSFGAGSYRGRSLDGAAVALAQAITADNRHDLAARTDAQAPAADAPTPTTADTGRYGVTNASTHGYAARFDVLRDAERCAGAITGRVVDLLPHDRPRLDTALAPRYVDGDLTRIGALASDDYRIDRVPLAGGSYAGGGLWQAARTSGPRSSGGGHVGNLGTVDSLDVAIHVVARDAGAYADAWQAAHPATVKVDGLRYTRVAGDLPGRDGDEDVYVHLAAAGDPDDFRDGVDPLARLVIRDSRGIKPARWSYVPTGDVDVDPESGYPAPAYVWTLADGRTSPNDETTAFLDAAYCDVGDQYEAFTAADRLMGDPYP